MVEYELGGGVPKRVPTAILLAAAADGADPPPDAAPIGVRDDATGLWAPVARGVVAR